EQENKSDYQKIVRISDAQNCKSVLISPAWRTPRTGVRPQILVKMRKKKRYIIPKLGKKKATRGGAEGVERIIRHGGSPGVAYNTDRSRFGMRRTA
ncbi:MAG: hypothetical protein MR051_01265, partial [Lentisphaeria bacterium]|nr:hypothetical protein [Lentisphaeria bacterium]